MGDITQEGPENAATVGVRGNLLATDVAPPPDSHHGQRSQGSAMASPRDAAGACDHDSTSTPPASPPVALASPPQYAAESRSGAWPSWAPPVSDASQGSPWWRDASEDGGSFSTPAASPDGSIGNVHEGDRYGVQQFFVDRESDANMDELMPTPEAARRELKMTRDDDGGPHARAWESSASITGA
eukprot:NODE_1782_length_1063_cov_340.137897.p2 GENE.NODE_1782_length_1063_cov_340.137897~~NODE_1782_length_1063_cov_340.137897.p2  ORF type:complete len:185 (+),score=27.09 NODE_1782_length_1063_cov_340.137897:30-584(+)